MTEKKKTKAVEKDPLTEGIIIYVGPNLIKYQLMTTNLYSNGLPKLMFELIERMPELRSLFVPITEYRKAAEQLQREGSSLAQAYQKVLKGV